jgi:hypothetical protein
VHSIKLRFFIFFVFLFGCGSMQSDLFPSRADKQPVIQAGTTGPSVGQLAPDFTLSDTLGNQVTLSSVVPSHEAIVLYFTMWCPTCDSHMSYLRDNVIPQHPGMIFYAVDYVSGSVPNARNAEVSNGYDGSGFVTLADTTQSVLNVYHGTMGTTVVIDRNGIIHMNEEFKADRLQNILTSLP